MKEITGKIIVCNLHRFLQFLVIEIFYRARQTSFLGEDVPNNRKIRDIGVLSIRVAID